MTDRTATTVEIKDQDGVTMAEVDFDEAWQPPDAGETWPTKPQRPSQTGSKPKSVPDHLKEG